MFKFRSALSGSASSVQVFITRLTAYWLLAMATVVLLMAVSHVMLDAALQQQEQEIALLRLSGRQRVYSQQIALFSLQLVTTQDETQRARLRGDLAAVVSNMRHDHQQLVAHSAVLPPLQAVYSGGNGLDARVAEYLAAAEHLVNRLASDLSPDDSDLRLVQNAAPGLLDDLSTVVGIFQTASLNTARSLSVTNQIRAILILAALAAQGGLVIRPMIRRLRRKAELLAVENAERQRVETELRAKQRFIEQVTTAVPDLVMVYDIRQQRSVYVNHRLDDLLGYTVEEIRAADGAVMSGIFHPDDLPLVLLQPQRYEMLTDGERIEQEYRVRHRKGHWLWLHGVGVVFERDPGGQVTQILVVAHDITQAKAAAQHAAELQIERDWMRFLTEFVTNMSHDFRTPLAIINSSAYLIGKLTDEKRRQEKAIIISKQVERLEHLLTQVLFTARLDNTDEYHLTRVRLTELIENTLSSIAPEYRRSHQIAVQVTDYQVVLNGNAVLLERALVNLLENALVYTPPEGHITLSAYRDGERCVLEIADTGVGIAAADLPRIFEPFYRADQARAAATGGMGLGLTMVKKIVELHDGDITIESEPGQGTRVRLFIPLAAAMQPA